MNNLENFKEVNSSGLTKKRNEYQKQLDELLKNEAKYDEIKDLLVKNAKELLGDDIFENFYLPENFDLDNLDSSFFDKPCKQELPLPFNNSTIQDFLKMPKKPINSVYTFNNKGKNIVGVYMLGTFQNKPVLFAFSIVKNVNPKKNIDFNIKLDVCIQGRTWLPVARLDSFGSAHPNFFVDGKVVKNVSEIEASETPHIHLTSEETQVVCHNNLRYSTSKSLDNTLRKEKLSSDNSYFKKCFNAFLKFTNSKIAINENIKDDYNYSFKEPLFDYTKIEQVKYPVEKEQENGI